jgi:hypothetical protein
VDVIHFLALGFRRMSFGINFLVPRPRKMNYLCIKLNLSGFDLTIENSSLVNGYYCHR